MDLNQLVKDLEEIKVCIENDHIEKAEDLLGFVIGEVAIAAQQSVQADGWRCPECDTVNADDVGLCESCGYSKSRRR